MSGLGQFEYDVFLSYGWAGIRNPTDADRGWVAEFKRQLEAQLSGELGHGARIYLDLEDSQNGELPGRLDAAVMSSAIFVSVITPGSCRPDSWCHHELATFDDPDALVLPGRKQIFTVLLRDVPNEQWPEVLRPMTPYPFVTNDAKRRPLPMLDLADTRTEAGRLVQSLAIDIARTSRDMEAEITRTVLLGWAAPALEQRVERLRDEIRARGGNLVRVKDRSGESERAFSGRVERQSRNASLAVHLVARAGSSPRNDWAGSIETVQIDASARRFARDSNRLIVWHEPVPGQDLCERCSVDAQVLRGTGFEYLQSVINDSVTRHAGATVVTPGDDGPVAKYVFVKCTSQDAGRLDALRHAIEARGMRLRLPLFQGDELRRNKINQELIQRSHGVAVYFGSLNDLEAFDACQTVWDTVKSSNQSVPKAVLIDPATDPIRQNFWYPEFANYPSSAVERFIAQVSEAGIA